MDKICLLYIMLLWNRNQSFGLEVNVDIVKNLHSKFSEGEVLYEVNFGKELQLKIPRECAQLQFCEEIPDFPEDEITKLIDILISDKIHFNKDQEISDCYRDVGDSEGIELCRSQSTLFQPKAVKIKNEWYLVLNSKHNMVQSFRGERCLEALNAPCSQLVSFSRGYEGRCVQKYSERRIIVLSANYKEVVLKYQPVETCCSCVAFSNENRLIY